MNTNELKKLKVTELRKMVEERGINPKGMKVSELVMTIADSIMKEQKAEAAAAEKKNGKPKRAPKSKRDVADVPPPPNYKDPINLVFSEGVLYRCDTKCWWGKSSRVDEDELEVDPEIITGVKTLVNPNRLAGIRSFKSHGERLIKKRGYPFIGLRGVQWIPKKFIGSLETDLVEAQTDFYKEVKDFVKKYGSYKQEWKEKSGEHYDEKLYPTEAELETRFRFEWQKFIIQVPDRAGILSEAEYKAEVEKHKARLGEWLNATLTSLSGKFYRILVNLQKKLDSGDPIKPKTISSLKAFVESFEAMNVTKNGVLEDMVNKAMTFIGSSGAKEFNQEEKLRKATAKRLSSVIDSFEKVSKEDSRFNRAIDF
jgi:hypothetical protein